MAIESGIPQEPWRPGMLTSHPPDDAVFLMRVLEGGGAPYLARGSAFGATLGSRDVFVIYRGRRGPNIRWEVILSEGEQSRCCAFVLQLQDFASVAIDWLRGSRISELGPRILACGAHCPWNPISRPPKVGRVHQSMSLLTTE